MLFLNIFLFLSMTAFGADLTSEQMQTCEEIKALRTDDSTEKYLKMARLLQSKGLSACACAKHFMNARKLKVQKEIESKFGISSDFWKQVEVDAQKVRIEDKKNAHIEFDVNVSSEHQEMLTKAYNEQQVFIPLKIQYSETSMETKVQRRLKFMDPHVRSYYHQPIVKLKPASDWIMSLENIVGLKGPFLHELKHIDRNHMYVSLVLQNKLKNTPFEESTTYKKFKRYHEAEADRVPAACGTCDDAKSLTQQLFHLNYKHTNFTKDRHPSTFKRCEWAYKIMMLKEAEEKLKNS